MVLWCCAAGTKREIATIYEIVQDANGAAYALPDYQFTCEWIGLGADPRAGKWTAGLGALCSC